MNNYNQPKFLGSQGEFGCYANECYTKLYIYIYIQRDSYINTEVAINKQTI